MGSLLRALTRSPLIHKLVKYSAASVAGVVVGQATLIFCLEALDWPALAANLASVTLGCVPNYTINRYWTWQQSGQNRLWGEVIPFWFMAAAGTVLSMLAVAFADHQWGTTLAVSIANLSGFGVLWVAKFLVLDKLMWRVVQDLHPEVEVPADVAGEAPAPNGNADGTATANAENADGAATASGPNGSGSALGGAVSEQIGQPTPPR